MASYAELSAQRSALLAQGNTLVAQRDAALAVGDKQGAALYQEQANALVSEITSLTGQMADALDQAPNGSTQPSPTSTTGQNQSTPAPNARDDGPTQAPTSGGVGAGTTSNSATSVRPDDNPETTASTKNATVSAVDNVFGESTIVPQANVLDQYASYTYQASVYLMKPETFNAMVASRTKSLNGAQLLFQSGGAPVGGRNPYFTNDYYIDKIELKSTITGKGTNAAHNVNTIKMTLIEPSGITLISNLDKAVQSYLGTGNAKKNFASQLYLLVIKFFGYDADGNLVQAGQSNGITNTIGNAVGGVAGELIKSGGTAFVEKYYPMAINKINFKVANKLVEYEIEATAPQYQIAVGQSRGTIPYNVELSGMSVKDALAGSAEVGPSTATTTRTKTPTTERQQQDSPQANPTSAPANATAAPNPKTTIRKGLMEALNQYQKDLVNKNIYTVADEYILEFTDATIEQAKITVPKPDFKNTSPQAANTAKEKLNPGDQAVDPNSRILTITAGQQIVQVIDAAVRNSSYVKAQQTATIDENTQQQKSNGKAGNNVAWFKISMQATPIKWDPKRNDYAYKIKYIVGPYRINQTNSNYFPQPKYKGPHKQYNYWFTGQNTQVLSYEQTYNALYTYVLSGGNTDPAKTNDQAKYNYQPRSGQSSQGADLRTNEPSANLADSLYNPADLGIASLSIVGDPAWLQQGEASFSPPSKGNFISSAFLPDGTINFEAQQILFEIIINTPTDYDLTTGIMDVNNRNVGYQNTTNQSKPANQSYVYIANEVTSEFNKGKFTQSLKGTLLPRTATSATSTEGRASVNGLKSGAVTADSLTSDVRTTKVTTAEQIVAEQNASFEYGTTEGSQQTRMLAEQDAGLFDEPKQPPTPQPAPPPGAPTSNGDVTPADTTAPQNASTTDKVVANEEETAAVNAYVAAGGTFPRGTGPITSGPLFDNVVAAKASLTARQQAAASSATTSSAPQQIAKDDQ
jgi:hypothetical protein